MTTEVLIERALGAAALLHAHVERPIIDRGEDKPQWLIDAGADIHAARMAILSRPAPFQKAEGEGT